MTKTTSIILLIVQAIAALITLFFCIKMVIDEFKFEKYIKDFIKRHPIPTAEQNKEEPKP